MSKPSPGIIQRLLTLRYNVDRIHPLGNSTPLRSPALQNPLTSTFSSSSTTVHFHPSSGFSSSATNSTSEIQSALFARSTVPTPTSSNGTYSRFFSSLSHNVQCSRIPISRSYHSSSSQFNAFSQITPPAFSSRSFACRKLSENFPGFRFFSSKSSDLGKINGNFAKKIIDKPVTAVTSAFSRYREAIGLQFEAFFKRNYLFLLGAGGVMVCALLWRIMFGIATTFVGLSEGMAKYGFLALSSAIVAFAGLYVRARFTINPDKVYRMAMRNLQTSAGILEVMGAPLSGSDLRAYVMSGGGLRLKNFKPNLRSKRCFLIFPLRGSERRGLVSVEVKKKNGKYDMKLLAVDIPMASGPDQRLFLIGDEKEYRVGGGLIAELRDPVVKAMAAAKEFDDLDKIEEEEEEEKELQEAERKRREEMEKLEKEGH